MITSGITTGLMGYSLRKEMFGDALFYRELQTFSYVLYSLDLSGLRPSVIQQNIMNEYTSKYSGDINVKVFQLPADYLFPNDSIRVAQFSVEVQVKSPPQSWQSELGTPFYSGLDSGFLSQSGVNLIDFKESFTFETNENGNKVFSHDLSFILRSGSKQMAATIASGIYAKDRNTTFGITTMVGGLLTLADDAQFQSYYSETYAPIRNAYSFSRKRELLPLSAATYVNNVTHTIDLKEDGIMDITEKGSVKGNLNFAQAQAGMETQIANAYTRCSQFYSTYASIVNETPVPDIVALVQSPVRILRFLNRYAMTADYEVSYTNNPQFKNDGTSIEETFDLNEIELGVVDLKHNFNFAFQKRASSTNFATLINNAVVSSPTTAQNYYALYYPDGGTWPIHLIKREMAWPNRKVKGAKITMTYNSHPKYFYQLQDTVYNLLEYKVDHTKPVDMVTEYKVINRPNKLSVMNYAYQTERGQLSVTIDANIGRQPDEFVSSPPFRRDLAKHLTILYQFACTLFFAEFKNVIPMSFTYYMNDIKYTYSSEMGQLQLIVTFTYTIKKYIG